MPLNCLNDPAEGLAAKFGQLLMEAAYEAQQQAI
jgi:hypothetical protein